MPVSAREASLYTAITIAEYYRDMGHHVALLADSTSRWAEALREISGRLGEMPAEEGYPPYLSSRLAAYYERAGRVTTLGGGEGSVTLISAISPPGGDPTEPVTRHTRSFARVFWTLDRDLASARLFPAVSITGSYSDVPVELETWWNERIAPDWTGLRRDALSLLEEANRLEGTARLIGADSLPERQRFILWISSLIKEGFLAQSAFDPIDASCSPERQARLLRVLLAAASRGLRAVAAGVIPERIAEQPAAAALARARSTIGDADSARLDGLYADFERACETLEVKS
jgi:V/A-type H+-transporting ATPase subunit A